MKPSLTDEQIFTTALSIEDASKRCAYIDEASAGDVAQRSRIADLLKGYDDAGSFLNKPVAEIPPLPRPEIGTADPGKFPPHLEATHSDSSHGSVPVRLDFLAPSDNPRHLGTLGPYVVEEVLGRGGMGIVLRAIDSKLNRVVAIKVLTPELAANRMAGKRFLREAQAAAAVSHDHVVTIYAVDDASPVPYLVMECIVGQSLQQKIDRTGALGIKEILRIGMQIASGLAAAHKQGLVHRDIKPANILLENGIERVKITDFGLARAVDDVGMTQSGQVTGTPQYMSPEQAMGEQVDHRSDLFSLGSVLYTMCTGRPAFRATSTVAMLRRVVDDAPRPIREINPEIPEWLTAIIDKLMAKKPIERFQTATEVATELERWLAHYQRPETIPVPATILSKAEVANASPDQRGIIRRAWDEWWSEKDRWFAISVQAVLVVLHLLCMIFFLSFNITNRSEGGQKAFKFLLGVPTSWFRFEINDGTQRGFSSSFNLLTSSVLMGLIGIACYYAVWRIEQARNPKTSGWNKPQVIIAFWGIMAAIAIGAGMKQGHSILNEIGVGQVAELKPNPSASPSTMIKPSTGDSNASAPVLEELRKQVNLATQDLEQANARYKAQAIPRAEVIVAETQLAAAQLRLAQQEGPRESVIRFSSELVRLAEENLQLVRQRVDAKVATATELRAAEKALSDAKLRSAGLEPNQPEPPTLSEQ